jgi:hypothetical protein
MGGRGVWRLRAGGKWVPGRNPARPGPGTTPARRWELGLDTVGIRIRRGVHRGVQAGVGFSVPSGSRVVSQFELFNKN